MTFRNEYGNSCNFRLAMTNQETGEHSDFSSLLDVSENGETVEACMDEISDYYHDYFDYVDDANDHAGDGLGIIPFPSDGCKWELSYNVSIDTGDYNPYNPSIDDAIRILTDSLEKNIPQAVNALGEWMTDFTGDESVDVTVNDLDWLPGDLAWRFGGFTVRTVWSDGMEQLSWAIAGYEIEK